MPYVVFEKSDVVVGGHKAAGKGQIFFGRQVSSYTENDDGTVQVAWIDLRSGTNHSDRFAGIHVRTGRLAKPRSCSFDCECAFTGQIRVGLQDDIRGKDLAGKLAVVVGNGSFTVEAASRCLKYGAKSITLLACRPRFHLFDLATHVLDSFYSPLAAHGSPYSHAVWDKLLSRNRKAAVALGVEEPDIQRPHDHVTGAEVDHLVPDAVATTAGEAIPCELLIKAFGFDAAPPAPLKNKTICDSVWADWKANQMTIHGTCVVPPQLVLGPTIPGASLLLVSYFKCAVKH
eukprot:jgi/Mesvir1/4173/Mv17194-RA.1